MYIKLQICPPSLTGALSHKGMIGGIKITGKYLDGSDIYLDTNNILEHPWDTRLNLDILFQEPLNEIKDSPYLNLETVNNLNLILKIDNVKYIDKIYVASYDSKNPSASSIINIYMSKDNSNYTKLETIIFTENRQIKSINLFKILFIQNNQYYTINNNYINLGQSNDNNQLINWLNKYGYEDISILTKSLNNKMVPMDLNNDNINVSWDIDLNDVIDSINLIEKYDRKYIQYNCDNYKIIDEIKKNNDGKFDVIMKEIS